MAREKLCAKPSSIVLMGVGNLLSIVLICAAIYPTQASAQFGDFIGTLMLEDVPPSNREFKVTAEFAYRDQKNKLWTVPKGTVVDGASIPQFFWSFIGGPWEGSYRRASVIHDYYCVSKDEPWPLVHEMFYNAMRAGGVSPSQAGWMYYAVRRFGPRWEKTARSVPVCEKREGGTCVSWKTEEKLEVIKIQPAMNEAQALEFKSRIEKEALSLEQISKLADTQLAEELLRAGDKK